MVTSRYFCCIPPKRIFVSNYPLRVIIKPNHYRNFQPHSNRLDSFTTPRILRQKSHVIVITSYLLSAPFFRYHASNSNARPGSDVERVLAYPPAPHHRSSMGKQTRKHRNDNAVRIAKGRTRSPRSRTSPIRPFVNRSLVGRINCSPYKQWHKFSLLSNGPSVEFQSRTTNRNKSHNTFSICHCCQNQYVEVIATALFIRTISELYLAGSNDMIASPTGRRCYVS